MQKRTFFFDWLIFMFEQIFFMYSSYLSKYLIIKWLEFSIIDIRYLFSARSRAEKVQDAWDTLHTLHCIILLYTYKLYILYRIVLRVGSSRANECSWPLADLPLITYVQDVLEMYAWVENRNFRCICRTYISSAQKRVREYIFIIFLRTSCMF